MYVEIPPGYTFAKLFNPRSVLYFPANNRRRGKNFNNFKKFFKLSLVVVAGNETL
jgi:hypothetical protein